ncbi:Thymidylate synthase ThyX [compost metagenome]
MEASQATYDALRAAGIPAEDARMVLPQAATCNLVLTGNLRALLEFYAKRHNGTHAQLEIRQLAEAIRSEITQIDAWTTPFFEYYSQS